MAFPTDDKAALSHSYESVQDLALPPKAATVKTTEATHGSSPASSTKEKIIELRRDSIPSTPHSLRNDNPFDTDVEAMITTTNTNNNNNNMSRKCTTTISKADCPSVWPGKEHWKQKAKTAKRNRHNTCNCLAHLSKRNRIIAKILIGLLIVGIAVGVGFGVSKPLGAPIWGVKDDEKR
ncbi:hypothetical protein VD0002_g6213 [Verticillium dahliae]|uniref:Uncharacterized protein n=2 Tax=Verticillium dahliae TaxID=27337 RepID=G2X4J2_VERDV|nr:uncharacterized protein VDAG_05074 [Verticillium dahliae VdLs.17]KAF3347110.1 AP-1 complex subunit mu-1 [Verticillium dahliae VDG2]KAH6693165.1 hypothetical protein EV126DRAFT_87291 [Verticillium dahliae]EGY23636.1 hypothetical protein VDAG_05074 [Verticillium dahliae VdLs.17]PNH29923.1 hypothetical protein BJF96_g6734 [Verticillium dahliae]PNH50967.1 hypothetical protein VD0003_g6253 [Verticillium dahliae]